SRMGVFTGCLPSTTGIFQNENFWENPQRRRTFIEVLGDVGYYRMGAGKVFHGHFDYAEAGRTGADHAKWIEIENRSFLWEDFHTIPSEPMPPERPLNHMFDFTRFGEVSPWNHHFDWGVLPADREDETPDSVTCRVVSDLLRTPPSQPFFCAAGLYKPHLPWYAPQRFFDLYPLEEVSLPFVKKEDLEDVPEIARSWAESPPDHATVTAHGQWRNGVQGYLASISYCDSLIAQIVQALDRSPVFDNTIVVLWGDNGFHLGEKLHWRKFVLWEEATRVPLIIVPPKGMEVVARVDEPVSLIDIFPTLFDLCELAQGEGVDGQSLLPSMHGERRASRGAVSTWLPGNHSLRRDHWRYTRYCDGSEELYDHSSDPYEWKNLALLSRFEGKLNEMRSHLPLV
ncbi:MAG: sulfatase-like hydrolase/transferase, partial [Rhizobiaceae bacterium]